IFVDGKPVTVPAQIGIGTDGSFAELHTHDATGIIHFESPTQANFTLGQFFDDWGVFFTKSCIGSLCNSGDKTLQIFVNGNPVSVPAQIGIGTDGSFAELHTHDATGIIHFESPTQANFTLGQFFDDWGVFFTKSCIGSLCNSGDKTLQVFVNGNPVS